MSERLTRRGRRHSRTEGVNARIRAAVKPGQIGQLRRETLDVSSAISTGTAARSTGEGREK